MLSKVLVTSALVTLADAGKCPFGYGKPDQVAVQIGEQITAKTREELATYPSEVLTCPAGKTEVMTTDPANFTKDDYEQIVQKVISVHDAIPDKQDQVSFAGCLVRLEGHDLMDFRRVSMRRGAAKKSGGSDGCVNFKDPDNMGLPQCLAKAGLEDIYGEWCDKVSLADFIVIAAEAVMGRLAVDYDAGATFKAGTLASQFKDQFRCGRTTLKECPNNVGLMPNPENGCNDLQAIFVNHIYNIRRCGRRCRWALTAALSGAHTIGSAKLHNSGYEGAWSDPKNAQIFNNNYYHALIGHGWGPNLAVNGNPDKNNWKRVDVQKCNEPFEMMLNTDMCLAYQFNKLHIDCMKENNRSARKCKKFEKKGTFLNAKTADGCCAWTQQNVQFKRKILNKNDNDYCGLRNAGRGDMRGACCIDEDKDSIGDCDSFRWPKGPAFNVILHFAETNAKFYSGYLKAWKIATENGWSLHEMS